MCLRVMVPVVSGALWTIFAPVSWAWPCPARAMPSSPCRASLPITLLLAILSSLPARAGAQPAEQLRRAFKDLPSVEKVELQEVKNVVHAGRSYRRLVLLVVNDLYLKRHAQRPVSFAAQVEIDYDNVDLFADRVAPGHKVEYLILVTSQFGANKVNVYGFLEQQR